MEVLFPGLEIDRVEVTLLRTKGGEEDWERKLSLSAGEPELDSLMEEVRALRFRRAPLESAGPGHPCPEPVGPRRSDFGRGQSPAYVPDLRG